MSLSAEINLGIDSQARPSSRVLKPPGGGHSNIFAEPDAQAPKPRPKYNQQNSSNLNSCMNTTDPNETVAQLTETTSEQSSSQQQTEPSAGKSSGSSGGFFNGHGIESVNDGNQQNGRGRVPPGGFSSGLW